MLISPVVDLNHGDGLSLNRRPCRDIKVRWLEFLLSTSDHCEAASRARSVMSGSPTWYSWFTFPFFAPLSGAVSQDITASPYQGVPEIEIAIIKEVGSFGQQLGIISEAVKELAEKVGAMPAAKEPRALTATPAGTEEPTPLEKLGALIRQVDQLKEAYKGAVERDAERAVARLNRVDPEATARLADRLR